MLYLRARVYDPVVGRFLSRDPLFGAMASPLSLNRFSYAGDNPVNRSDPSGLASDIGSGVNDPSPGIPDPASAADNECTTTLGGLLKFYGVRATCLDIPVGVVGFAVVQTSSGGLRIVPFAVFAKAPKDGDNDGAEEDRNPKQDKILTPGDIQVLQEAGYDPEALKDYNAGLDLYKDNQGNVYVKPKGGRGAGEPTGINIKVLRRRRWR